MRKLRDGEASTLGDFAHDIDDMFFVGSQFRMAAANTKPFALMLAANQPISFISGSAIARHSAVIKSW